MLKLGKQILHALVLLITGIALIGVNVTRSGCIHSDRICLEIKVLPAEDEYPCEEGCACCRAFSRHDFYKITDSSLIERVLQMQLSVFTLSECNWEVVTQIPVVREGKECFSFYRKFPQIPPSLESLCAFLC